MKLTLIRFRIFSPKLIIRGGNTMKSEENDMVTVKKMCINFAVIAGVLVALVFVSISLAG